MKDPINPDRLVREDGVEVVPVWWYFEPGEPVLGVKRMPSHQSPGAPHLHQGFSELVVIREGTAVHSVGDESYPVTKGDVYVIPPGQIHDYMSPSTVVLDNILFDFATLRIPDLDIRATPGYHALFTVEPRLRQRERFEARLRLSSRQLAHALALVDVIYEEVREDAPGGRYMAVSRFMELVCFLSRCYAHCDAPATQAVLRLSALLGMLEREYSRRITLDEMAATAFMSHSSLQRAFREALGISPGQYLIRLRVAKAAELLQHPSLPLEEVACRVGFNSGAYLTRQFRKVMNEPPNAYRKRVRA